MMKYLLVLMALLCLLGTTSAQEVKKSGEKIEKAISQLDEFKSIVGAKDDNKVGLLFNRRQNCATAGGFGYSWNCGGGGCGGTFGGGGGHVAYTAGGIAVQGGPLMQRYMSGQGLIVRLDAWDNLRFPGAAPYRHPGHRIETASRIFANSTAGVANIYSAGAFSAIGNFYRRGGPQAPTFNVSANAFAGASSFSSSNLQNYNSFSPNFNPSFTANPVFNNTFQPMTMMGQPPIFIP